MKYLGLPNQTIIAAAPFDRTTTAANDAYANGSLAAFKSMTLRVNRNNKGAIER